MNEIDSRLRQAIRLRHAGQYEGLLSLLRQFFVEIEQAFAPNQALYLFAMVEWETLVPAYPPARVALEAIRNDQIARMLSGKPYFGLGQGRCHVQDALRPTARFSTIVAMNRVLGDARSTHELFVQLDEKYPKLARRFAWQALPDIVTAGDFALAERYRGDPLARLDEVNRRARTLPLFPPYRKPPDCAWLLLDLVCDVRIGMAVLRGQGYEAEPRALREALLAGLESDEVRALAQRELDEPGAIDREVLERQRALANDTPPQDR